MSGRTLIEKIEALPATRIAEVEDFVDFIALREEDRALARAGTALSEAAFMQIWDNAEDHAYNSLSRL